MVPVIDPKCPKIDWQHAPPIYIHTNKETVKSCLPPKSR